MNFNWTWTEILDLTLVAVLLFYIYKLVKGTIAGRVFAGYFLVYLTYLLVRRLGLEWLTRILEYFMGVGAIALIVLFQQEIRRFLLQVGKSTMLPRVLWERFFKPKGEASPILQVVKPIVEATKTMSNDCTGALIVIEHKDDLSKIAETGDAIDAELSKRLLVSIFSQYSPLHDGAVVISENRIQAARCVLPVSDTDKIPAIYGFRHRAGLGISEVSDALVVIVSEETGRISIVFDGELVSSSQNDLEEKILAYLLDEEYERKSERKFVKKANY